MQNKLTFIRSKDGKSEIDSMFIDRIEVPATPGGPMRVYGASRTGARKIRRQRKQGYEITAIFTPWGEFEIIEEERIKKYVVESRSKSGWKALFVGETFLQASNFLSGYVENDQEYAWRINKKFVDRGEQK